GGDGVRIPAEARQVLVAGRVDDARVLVRGELEALAVNEERLFQLREEHRPAGRWRESGDEQAVVAARVEAGEGGAGKAAQAVRLQPLALARHLQAAANFDLVHLSSPEIALAHPIRIRRMVPSLTRLRAIRYAESELQRRQFDDRGRQTGIPQ